MPEDGDGDDQAPSLFEELLDEHCGPWSGRVGDLAVDVDPPSAEDVCELDDAEDLADELELLAGEDLADELLDLLEDRPADELLDVVDDLRRHFALHRPPAQGMTAVVAQIDRYGAAIEADLVLSGSGLLLIDWWREPDRYPWSLLLRLLQHLPEGGHYDAARRDDDDLARQLHDLVQSGRLRKPSVRPPLVGHTFERELLTSVVETLERIEHGVWGASPKFKGKGGKRPKRRPRPQTAKDRLDADLLLVEHDEVGAALLGSRYTPRRRIR